MQDLQNVLQLYYFLTQFNYQNDNETLPNKPLIFPMIPISGAVFFSDFLNFSYYINIYKGIFRL